MSLIPILLELSKTSGEFVVITTPEVITPDPPTLSADDSLDTLSASHSLGSSEILVSENNGLFAAYTGIINVGNLNVAAGYWKFKIKSAANRNESSIVASPAFNAVSQNTTPAAPTVFTDDETNQIVAQHSLGDSEIVYSTNNGSFIAYAGVINAGDFDYAAGYWKFKIKAATGRNESTVSQSGALTQSVIPDTGGEYFGILSGQSNTGYAGVNGSGGYTPLTPTEMATWAIHHNAKIIRIREFPAEWLDMVTGENTANNDGVGNAICLVSSTIKLLNDLHPTKKVWLYHGGKGGAGLATEDQPRGLSWWPYGGTVANGLGYWDDIHRQLIYMAVQKADALGKKLNLKWNVWMQGETDCENPTAAANYLPALIKHFDNERTYLQNAYDSKNWGTVPNYKKVIVKMRPYSTSWQAVVDAQTSFCNNPANNAILVDVDSVGGGLHFQPIESVEVGRRIFEVVKNL